MGASKGGARLRKQRKPAEETFGERLARLRKAKGYTQTELGQRLGVSQRVMTYYETAGRPPGHLLPRLAEHLAVTVDALLGNSPAPDMAPPAGHSRLWRKLIQVEQLSEADRRAVVHYIEALLAKQRQDNV